MRAYVPCSAADWLFVRRAMPRLAALDPEITWEWVEQHALVDCHVLMLANEAGPFGVLLYAPGVILWVTGIFTLPGYGDVFAEELADLLRRLAREHGCERIGFHTVRAGWARVLTQRLGFKLLAERSYTRIELGLGEPRHGWRQPADHDDQPGASTAAG